MDFLELKGAKHAVSLQSVSIGLQDCGASAEALHFTSCSTGGSQWRGGSSTPSCSQHSGQPPARPRAATCRPAIFSGSAQEVRQQRQRTAWPIGPEGARCKRQQALPSAGFSSSATPASPSRLCCECWPGSGISALEAAAGRRVSVRQLFHIPHAECQGQAAGRTVH